MCCFSEGAHNPVQVSVRNEMAGRWDVCRPRIWSVQVVRTRPEAVPHGTKKKTKRTSQVRSRSPCGTEKTKNKKRTLATQVRSNEEKNEPHPFFILHHKEQV